jgi:hypothetical protein
MEKIVFIDLRVMYPEWHVKMSKALKKKDKEVKVNDKRGVLYAPWCRDALLDLYRQTKCHFVIMSDEKNHGMRHLQDLFKERLDGVVTDYTVTEKMGQAAAINDLINRRRFTRYAVLSPIDEAVEHQVICDEKAGLLPHHVKEVVRYLEIVK